MKIRTAQLNEAEKIQQLILSTVNVQTNEDITERGRQRFKDLNSVSRIASRLKSSAYLTFICELNGVLIGVIAMRNFNQIDQLFIKPEYQGRGIASKLWNKARQTCQIMAGTKQFWVKSSTAGVPIYKCFGFLPVGKKRTEHGISFYPMQLNIVEN